MVVTTIQKATLKAYIEANSTWMAYANNGDVATQSAIDLQAEVALNSTAGNHEFKYTGIKFDSV